MHNWEDYYQILGVDRAASAEEIRAAWRRKALELHPDRLSQVSQTVRHSAEEELKKVNRAYEVLGNDQKRRSHDADWLRSNSPPKPLLEPCVIAFSDAEPGVSQSGSFVIRNDGGSYKSIWFSDPDSWVRVTGYASLQPDDELPLQVEITASGHDWGRYYTESIAVRLDGVEAAVRVQLQTKRAPVHTRPAPSPHRARAAPTPHPNLSQPAWGRWAIGAVALGIFIVAVVGAMAEESDSPASNRRPVVTQSWSQGTTGSNYLGAPTSQPWRSGVQTGSPGIQPWPSGSQPGYPGIQPRPSGFQTGYPGIQPSPFGFQTGYPGIQPQPSGFQQSSVGFPQTSPGVQPRSPGIRSSYAGQPNRSAGSQRGSGVTQRSSSGFGGYSGGFNFPGR